MTIRRAYVQPQQGGEGFARTRKSYGGNVPILAGDLVTANQVACFFVPKDFVLMALLGSFPKLDSGATLTLSLGDAANNGRLFAASAVGQAGGAMPALLAGGLFFQYPADTEILLTVPAGPVGAIAGVATIYLDGFLI